MRNATQPVIEVVMQWRDQANHLWCAKVHYPRGKARGNAVYCMYTIDMVGSTITIPCASVAQMWHEVAIRQQRPLAGF